VIPYYTDLPVLDLFGLLDRHIARLPGIRHHKFDVNYVLSRRPEYVLLIVQRRLDGELVSDYPHGQILLAEPRFLARYETFHDFAGARLYRAKK
jgi:hypothetical protein